MSCISLKRRSRDYQRRHRPSEQHHVYQAEFHSQPEPDYYISTVRRVSILSNPQDINLVAPSVVKDLRSEIEPCEGTVAMHGDIVGIKGSVVLQWTFEQSGKSPKKQRVHEARFFVPNIANPRFDATFAQGTARKYGMT